MIQVVVGNTLKRSTVMATPDTTLRAILEENKVDYTRGVMHLDGASLNPGDLNKTLLELGYDGTPSKDSCYLLNVVKADNA